MGVCMYMCLIGIILLSPVLGFDRQVPLAFHLIMAEAISQPVQHLKNQFWISSRCLNPLQTSNGALLLQKLET